MIIMWGMQGEISIVWRDGGDGNDDDDDEGWENGSDMSTN